MAVDAAAKRKAVLDEYRRWRGKIEVSPRLDVETPEDLARVYTPNVAIPCKEIAQNPQASFDLTRRGNLVAVVTDGSAVLGLGDIGPEAGMPVVEGKAALLKSFADIDGFPLCVKSQDVDEIVRTIELISGSFGAIHLEDIAAPRCFEIERRLRERLDIPVYHDDQHGTAVVVCAALKNALALTGRTLEDAKIVIVGAGASGMSTAELLEQLGAKNIILADTCGIVQTWSYLVVDATEGIVERSNPCELHGGIADAIAGADAVIGLSTAGTITSQMVESMAADPVVFALANPTPEIMPDEAKRAGAAVVATGRSDFPNQVNNVLAFPGIFRGALDVQSTQITDEMLVAATDALAALVAPEELTRDYIVPSVFDERVVPAIAEAVTGAARRTAELRA